MEKMKVEQERKKAVFTQEAIKEKVLNFVSFYFWYNQLVALIVL